MNDRRPPLELTDERTTLVAYLDYLRESMVLKAQGVSDEDVRRPLVPSGTSLLGLLHHLTEVEKHWFHHVLDGAKVEFAPLDEPLPPTLTAEQAVATYRSVTKTSNDVVERCAALETLARRSTFDDRRPTLRWILVHMVEETARHAGHADIIRELIDGETGR